VLKQEVIEAVRQGTFHIYTVSTVDEGIEVLAGAPAGQRRDDGTYPEGKVHFLAEKRLHDLAQKSREYGKNLDTNGQKKQTSTGG
jgi:hypothetical protein